LDYERIESPDFEGAVANRTTRDGVASGLVAWFSTKLHGNIGFSNAPGNPKAIYGMMYFPLSSPIEVCAGDSVQMKLRATLTALDYIWQWDTRITSGENPATVKAALQQSSFFAQPISTARLRKNADRYIPALNLQGEIDGLVLDGIRQRLSVGEIARQIADRYPQKFTTWQSALAHVGKLTERYSD
jgi:protein arginine N-methyltransferase 1